MFIDTANKEAHHGCGGELTESWSGLNSPQYTKTNVTCAHLYTGDNSLQGPVGGWNGRNHEST